MITIGIPTYRGADRLDALLRSIHIRTPELARGEAQVAVVDDGSPADDWARTSDVVYRYANLFPLRLRRHTANRGISAGWNDAVREWDAIQTHEPDDLCILVNDDVIVSVGWVSSLRHALRHSPDVGVVGLNWHAFLPEDVPALVAGPLSDRDVLPREPVTKVQDPLRRMLVSADPGRVMAPTGQTFAFRRSDFDALGGFDEGFRSFYEESDFGCAMAAKLQKIGVQLNWPFVWHAWSRTFGTCPELEASVRMNDSRARYRAKWEVPEGVHEFDYTNPKHLGALPPARVSFLRGPLGAPDEVML